MFLRTSLHQNDNLHEAVIPMCLRSLQIGFPKRPGSLLWDRHSFCSESCWILPAYMGNRRLASAAAARWAMSATNVTGVCINILKQQILNCKNTKTPDLQHNYILDPLLRRPQTSPRCHSCPSQEPFSCRGVLMDGVGPMPGAHLATTPYSGSAHQLRPCWSIAAGQHPAWTKLLKSCHQLHVPWTIMNHLVGLIEIQAANLNFAGECTVCTQAPYLA